MTGSHCTPVIDPHLLGSGVPVRGLPLVRLPSVWCVSQALPPAQLPPSWVLSSLSLRPFISVFRFSVARPLTQLATEG